MCAQPHDRPAAQMLLPSIAGRPLGSRQPLMNSVTAGTSLQARLSEALDLVRKLNPAGAAPLSSAAAPQAGACTVHPNRLGNIPIASSLAEAPLPLDGVPAVSPELH